MEATCNDSFVCQYVGEELPCSLQVSFWFMRSHRSPPYPYVSLLLITESAVNNATVRACTNRRTGPKQAIRRPSPPHSAPAIPPSPHPRQVLLHVLLTERQHVQPPLHAPVVQVLQVSPVRPRRVVAVPKQEVLPQLANRRYRSSSSARIGLWLSDTAGSPRHAPYCFQAAGRDLEIAPSYYTLMLSCP